MDNSLYVLVVSTLFLVTLLLISRYIISRFGGYGTKNGLIKLIDKQMVSPERFVYIINIKGKQYVLVSDRGGTKLLDIRDDLANETIETNSFQNTIINIIKKKEEKDE